jgi:hypothetical protein
MCAVTIHNLQLPIHLMPFVCKTHKKSHSYLNMLKISWKTVFSPFHASFLWVYHLPCLGRNKCIMQIYIPTAGYQTGTLVVCIPVAGTMKKAHSPLSCFPEFHCIQLDTQSTGTGTWYTTSATNIQFKKWNSNWQKSHFNRSTSSTMTLV